MNSKSRRIFVVCVPCVCACFGCAGKTDSGEPGSGGEPGCTGLCQPGQHRCNEEFLLACNDDCQGWSLVDTCDSADACDARANACRVCDVGDTRCNGNTAEVCAQDGSAWLMIEDCPNMCGGGTCDPCPSPGEVRCGPTTADPNLETRQLQTCVGGEGWSELDTCESEELCLLTVDAALGDPASFSGNCQPPICEAGERRCNPEAPQRLQMCAEGRHQWMQITDCPEDQACNPDPAGPECIERDQEE